MAPSPRPSRSQKRTEEGQHHRHRHHRRSASGSRPRSPIDRDRVRHRSPHRHRRRPQSRDSHRAASPSDRRKRQPSNSPRRRSSPSIRTSHHRDERGSASDAREHRRDRSSPSRRVSAYPFTVEGAPHREAARKDPSLDSRSRFYRHRLRSNSPSHRRSRSPPLRKPEKNRRDIDQSKENTTHRDRKDLIPGKLATRDSPGRSTDSAIGRIGRRAPRSPTPARERNIYSPARNHHSRQRSPSPSGPRKFDGRSAQRDLLDSPVSRRRTRSPPRSPSRDWAPGRRDHRGGSPSRGRSRDRDDTMYPNSGGGYYPPPSHGRPYGPPPIDTRYPHSPPHGVSPHHQYPPRDNYGSHGYSPPRHGWSSQHPSPSYPPHHGHDSRNYGPPRGGPPPSHYYSSHSGHASPSAGPSRGYSGYGSGPSPSGSTTPSGYQNHPNPSGYSSRGGRGPPPRGGHSQSTPHDSNTNQSSSPAAKGPPVRGGAHFSNLTWKPGVGTRGGQAPKTLFQTQQKTTGQSASTTSIAASGTEAVAPPADPNDPDNPFRVPDSTVQATEAETSLATVNAPDELGVPKESPNAHKNERGNSDTIGEAAKSGAAALQDTQSKEGPKISFNMKKVSASPASTPATKRDLFETKKPGANPLVPPVSRPVPPTDRDARGPRYNDHRSEYPPRDYRDARGPRDRYYDSPRADHRPDHPRERREPYHDSRYERNERPAPPPKVAKPPAPPLPDLRSSGLRPRFSPAKAVIPVKTIANTPVWMIRQLLDGNLKNHVKRLKEIPSDWKEKFPPEASLTEEHRLVKSQYPKQDDSVVGAGTYGQVYKTVNVYKPDQGPVALKRVAMASEGANNGFPFTSVRELGALVAIKDQRIPKYIESMVERVVGSNAEKVDLWYYMVFEYVPYDLAGILNHPTVKLELAHRKDLAKQMYEGLIWLHSVGILHRDIKAGNILVDHNCVLKLTDFGLAKRYDVRQGPRAKHTNRIVTIWYRCPELLLGDNFYGTEPDFWAAACVLGEILLENGQALFPGPGTDVMQLDYMWSILGKPSKEEWPGMTSKPWYNLLLLDDQYTRKLRDSGGTAKRYQRKFEDRYMDKFTPAAMDLLQSALQWDPAQRPDGKFILAHPFFVSEEPAAQRFTGLGEALGGDFHEFDYKKHRDAARAKAKQKEQTAKADQKKRNDVTAATTGGKEAKKRGPTAEDGIERDAKKAKRDSAGNTGPDDDMMMEVSMEPGAPKEPEEVGDGANGEGNVEGLGMDVDFKPSA